jgi:hypothetical protein
MNTRYDPVEIDKKAWEMYCAGNSASAVDFWSELSDETKEVWRDKAFVELYGNKLTPVDANANPCEEIPAPDHKNLLTGVSPICQKILDLLGVKDKHVKKLRLTIEAGDIAEVEIERYITEKEGFDLIDTITDEYQLIRKENNNDSTKT